MKKLDKMEVFRQCGFGDASINYGTSHMPHIQFSGYDKVMDYCYQFGYSERAENLVSSWELVKKVKDLETANARLLERNHELQVDNEESLKEVENQYKLVAALREDNTRLSQKLGNTFGHVEELKQENLEYSKRCDELRKQNLLYSEQIEKLYQLNGQLANRVVGTLETSPKSKFIITVEEF